MTGTEWFGTGRGGLNRYFTDFFAALRDRQDVAVTATAFGDAPTGGSSWGPLTGSTRDRMATSRADRLAPGTIVDRHFALYGPPAREHDGPVVTHFHGPWAAESAAAGESRLAVAAKRTFERRRYRGSDLYVVLSNYFRDVLVERYSVPAERISVIAPGVDLQRFQAADVADSAPMVLCVRRLERRMGIDTLITAWPEIHRRRPDATLVIVGTGGAEDELRAQAARLTGPASIRFLGATTDDELTALYRRATITVVPTRALEGFGLIALESLAAGRAPVVTDVGGLPDSVRGFDDSLVVAPDDAVALADRVAAALDGDRPSADRCRARAEQFTWAACADKHVTAYRGLV
ncbi:glycosyltransferase family 4 protein [Williamsia phyllosphaerae]|uniref:Glycosyl transferase n=1 Tax=Williamsia phyllosphaerae TaxID=885042 RepID=A0ABQ1UAN1_9NOCA|nr:glycosyltransferase family 4 protein [Williamsia phyllosphaerae]GGF12812.1 putative glycosyl transferase [Williamsia phyllosphaerae]